VNSLIIAAVKTALNTGSSLIQGGPERYNEFYLSSWVGHGQIAPDKKEAYLNYLVNQINGPFASIIGEESRSIITATLNVLLDVGIDEDDPIQSADCISEGFAGTGKIFFYMFEFTPVSGGYINLDRLRINVEVRLGWQEIVHLQMRSHWLTGNHYYY